MSSHVSPARFRYVLLRHLTLFALFALVGSACASPQTPRSEQPQSPIAPGAHEGAAFELGSFASVQTAEIATPLSERPLVLRHSDGGTGSSQRGGQLDPSIVERAIRKHLPTIRACYERESRRDPSLSGKVTVAFVIQPDGQVRDTEAIENSTGSEAVAACASRVLRQIHFAPGATRGEVNCVYPFLFGVRR